MFHAHTCSHFLTLCVSMLITICIVLTLHFPLRSMNHDVPIEKVYNATQRAKFRWAIEMTKPDFVF